MRADRPDTKCVFCGEALHWAAVDDGAECYVTELGHESCPDDTGAPFEHEPVNGLNWA